MKNQVLINLLILILITFLTNSCSDKNSGKSEMKSPVEIDSSIENKNLLYYYFENGKSKITKDPFQIPDSLRDRVLLVDTKLSPKERMSDKYVYRADLSKLNEKKISYSIILRKDFELNTDQKTLIIYTTNSCSVCTELRKYLDTKKIPYIDKNLEENPYYQKELAIKAQQSDRTISGVPVLDINGVLYMGFQKKIIDDNFK
ncbi:glutaredoxin family protein [bacterium]|nr:glutaredoxin family protein [bacterium]